MNTPSHTEIFKVAPALVLPPLCHELQVAKLSTNGLAACYIAGDQEDERVKAGVIRGDYQLVLFTPEMLLQSRQWRNIFLGKIYSRRLRTFVVDEAHTVKQW